MSTAIVHPRAQPRRGAVRPRSWWGRAWMRSVEEAAYAEGDLKAARILARSGQVGQILLDVGTAVATVLEGDDAWTVSDSCEPVGEWDLFVELVASRTRRVSELLGGELGHDLVEEAEESGVELLPFAGDLGWSCTCDPWVPPCRHALAVAYQVGWLIDRDAVVLLHLRGLPRETLLRRLHGPQGLHRTASTTDTESASADESDLQLAAEAAERAGRALELLAQNRPVEHLF